jgi:hypothetical protein
VSTIPNPVQRAAHRTGRRLASDDLLSACATEGGTFRQAPPPRPPAPPTWREILFDRTIDVGLFLVILATLFASSDYAFGRAAVPGVPASAGVDGSIVLLLIAFGLALWLGVRVARRKAGR